MFVLECTCDFKRHCKRKMEIKLGERDDDGHDLVGKRRKERCLMKLVMAFKITK